MSLSKEERETVITYNDADDIVNIWTAQRSQKTILDKFELATFIKNTNGGWMYEVPVENFRLGSALKKPRKLSEQARQAASERMKKYHAEKDQ